MNEPLSKYDPIKILHTIEIVGLVGIVIGTLFAVYADVVIMFEHGKVTLADLLLMFIYLEILAMVNHYFASGQLPIRFPLYIGMVALARYLILDIKAMDDWRIISVAGAILVLSIAVLIIRFGHCAFPYKESHLTSPFRRKTDKSAEQPSTNQKDTL